jgi:hypothetical protein
MLRIGRQLFYVFQAQTANVVKRENSTSRACHLFKSFKEEISPVQNGNAGYKDRLVNSRQDDWGNGGELKLLDLRHPASIEAMFPELETIREQANRILKNR